LAVAIALDAAHVGRGIEPPRAISTVVRASAAPQPAKNRKPRIGAGFSGIFVVKMGVV